MGKAAKRLLAGALATAVACTTVISSDMTAFAAEKAKAKATKIAGSTYTTADLIWEDNFDGDALNTKYWNYEAHEPGWVNAEWQSYPSQKENEKTGNIYVKDGKLTIQAKKTKNADGTYSYTSGRVNTQNKVDTKYGRFEARIKMPSGKGFLPAFWMMPTDENLYGQWPKCGEIDITEVHGSQPDTAYSTLHFGEPHTQRQNTYTLKKSDFSKDFHVYACEWEPGEIRFYIDNKLFYTVNDWFTKKEGFDEVTYPAPFDQPYYIILNLAVGGSWVGYPDETTAFGDNAQMVVDYVKVYQKDSYKETVKKPENTVKLRKPDKSGNYVVNSNFAKAEKLNDGKNWEFMLAGTGDASAKISKNALHITTKNAGDLDYSVQVVQPNIPMEQGYQYKLSFDAYADKNRTMITAITAPDNGYIRYFNDTKVNLTTKKKTYSYTFDMKSATDANGRVEFNLGNQGSTAGVHITNVKVVRVKKISTKEEKTVRPDGNYVYNGEFQEGTDRLNYWTVKKAKGASVKVTNTNNVRQLKAVVPASVKKASDVTVKQTKVAVKGGKSYVLSFDAKRTGAKDQTLIVKIAGKTYKAKLTGSMKTYKFELKPKKGTKNATLEFQLGTKGTTYIDNVRIMENGLIINGDFSAGLTGFEAWANNPSDVSYVVDTLKEDSAFSMDIKDTGDQDWHIQLKQTGVKLEKGQNYKISFKAKSTIDRDIKFVFQRNGLKRKNADGSEDWTVYFSDEQIPVTKKWQTYSAVFEMSEETDADTSMSFNFGAIGGKRITDKHTVLIDDIVLEKTDEKVEKDDSLIINGHFTKGLSPFETWAHDSAKMESGVDNDKVFYATISNTGSEDWHAQLKQVNIPLENGQTYTFSFRAKSDMDREIKYAFQKDGNKHNDDWTVYFEESNIPVTKEWKTYTTVFKMNNASDKEASFSFNLGAVGKQIKDKHTVMIDDVTLRVATEEEKKEVKNANAGGGGGGGGENPPVVAPPTTKPDAVVNKLDATTINNDMTKQNGANASATVSNGKTNITVETAGSDVSDIQVPVAQVSNVKPDQVNKITIKASKGASSTMSLRSARLRAEGDVTVKFAIQFGSNPPEILKSADGDEDIPLSDTPEEKVLFYQGTDATVQTPKILCYVGTVPSDTTVVIDKIDVEQADASEIPNGKSVLENSKFDGSYSKWEKSIVAPGSGSISFSAGKAITTVNNPGTADWNVQLKQMELPLAVGGNYKVTFKARSTVARTIKASVMAVSGDKYAWLSGSDVLLKENDENEVTYYIKNVPATMKVDGVDVDIAKANKGIFFSMGMITDEGYIAEDTPASTIEISDLSVTKVATTGTDSQSNPGTKPNHGTSGDTVKIGAGSLCEITADASAFTSPAAGVIKKVDGTNNAVKIQITKPGDANDAVMLKKAGLSFDLEATYEYSFKVTADKEWKVSAAMINEKADGKGQWGCWAGEWDKVVAPGETLTVTKEFIPANEKNESGNYIADDSDVSFMIQLGGSRNALVDGDSVTLTISDFALVKKPGGTTGGEGNGGSGSTPTESNGIIFEGTQDINDWGTKWDIPVGDWTQVEAGAKIVITADMITGQGEGNEYATFHVVDGNNIATQLLKDQSWDYASGGTQTKTITITQEMLDVAKLNGLSIQGWGFTIKKVVLIY